MKILIFSNLESSSSEQEKWNFKYIHVHGEQIRDSRVFSVNKIATATDFGFLILMFTSYAEK